ncbi:MAG: NADP-dependent isocitrate dehydrogenase [Holophaga sp.]|jgi:isocitrate dehydrogenase
MSQRIAMKTPLVEMDGDEMTRVLWQVVKDKLILPHVDLKTEYFDLGIKHRDDTDDQVTYDSAQATLRLGVAVKCATITATPDRVKEYGLKHLLPSPNATIRGVLDGTVFRKPIFARNVKPSVPAWTKPIHIGRHAYGDVYKNVEMQVPGPGLAELVFTAADGQVTRKTIMEMPGPGILRGIHNLDASIESFARACFLYALSEHVDCWFGAKDTISKTYDARFRDVFARIFKEEFQDRFKAAGLTYFYTLIDDAVARVMKSSGGMLWACMNYDGDVMSDMVSSACSSLAMMTSVLVSPKGYFEFEAAHGTVQKHYYRHLKGERTSTNPMALIFAWTGALRKRGELDGVPELGRFADALEQASLGTIEAGFMTGDLARLAAPAPQKILDSEEFMSAIAQRLSGR